MGFEILSADIAVFTNGLGARFATDPQPTRGVVRWRIKGLTLRFAHGLIPWFTAAPASWFASGLAPLAAASRPIRAVVRMIAGGTLFDLTACPLPRKRERIGWGRDRDRDPRALGAAPRKRGPAPLVAHLDGRAHPHASEAVPHRLDRKSTRLNSSHEWISYA